MLRCLGVLVVRGSDGGRLTNAFLGRCIGRWLSRHLLGSVTAQKERGFDRRGEMPEADAWESGYEARDVLFG